MNQNVVTNVKLVLSRKGISLTAVGKKLFPANEYPYAAINRAFKGACKLKSDQITELSKITGISLEELCSEE